MARAVVNKTVSKADVINFIVDNNFVAVRALLINAGHDALQWTPDQIKQQLLDWANEGYDIVPFINVPYNNFAPNYTGGLANKTSSTNKTSDDESSGGFDFLEAIGTFVNAYFGASMSVLGQLGFGGGSKDDTAPPPPPAAKDYTLYIMAGVGGFLLLILIVLFAFRKK